MNRSATMPTKNGEMIAATAVVPAARPICSPEKCSVEPSHVPMVTYHAPQTKYCRNISVDSLDRVAAVIGAPHGVRRSAFGVPGSRFSVLGSRCLGLSSSSVVLGSLVLWFLVLRTTFFVFFVFFVLASCLRGSVASCLRGSVASCLRDSVASRLRGSGALRLRGSDEAAMAADHEFQIPNS